MMSESVKNCPHQEKGWCIPCVKALLEKLETAEDAVDWSKSPSDPPKKLKLETTKFKIDADQDVLDDVFTDVEDTHFFDGINATTWSKPVTKPVVKRKPGNFFVD